MSDWDEKENMGRHWFQTSWFHGVDIPKVLPMPFGEVRYEYDADYNQGAWYRDHARNEMYLVCIEEQGMTPYIIVEGPQS